MSFSTTGSVLSKRAPRKQTLSILVCGATGTGKSSFINTLIGRRVLLESENQPVPSSATKLRFKPTVVEMEEPLSDGSRLVLTVTETEGFGTNLEHSSDIEQVADYIECKFDEVLAEESRIRRNPRFKDNRIDVCLYFIEPTGHGLREIDVLTLKRLASIVNLVPVLARSDTLTPAERVSNKRLVTEDLRFHDIDIFDFQYSDETHHESGELEDNEFYGAVPFAVTSTSEFNDQGDALYKRVLSFGTVDVLNTDHCDFKLLRSALLDGFLIELKDRTHDVLYETFRTHRLDPQQNHRTSLLMPQELADHAARLKQAQIDRETQLLREEERRVNAEIEAKRALLLKRERELQELEQRMSGSRQVSSSQPQPQQLQQQPQRVPNTSHSSDGHTHAEPYKPQSFVASSSQPSSATSTEFPSDQVPATGTNPFVLPYNPAQVPVQKTVHNPYASGSVGEAIPMGPVHSSVPGAYPEKNAEDGYVDGYIDEADNKELQQRRVRQSRSKKELREHADKLHAELGSLEAHKEDIKRKVATATSSRSLHTQLENNGSTSTVNQRVGSASQLDTVPDDANTSPLKIKKAAAV